MHNVRIILYNLDSTDRSDRLLDCTQCRLLYQNGC